MEFVLENQKTDNIVFLAPMAGITDMSYRNICSELGAGMTYSEMVSAKGLVYGDRSSKVLTCFGEKEKCYSLQIFGSEPEIMAQATEMLNDKGHFFLDINMGCPAPKVVKNGDGSALMKDPERISSILKRVVKVSEKPVSIKIRKGWDNNNINAVEIAKRAEQEGVKAITVHGRTRDQYYSGKADWDIVREVKDAVKIKVIGNGDILCPENAKKMIDYTGCDAVMIGRASEGNPWIFRQILDYLDKGTYERELQNEEKIKVILEHIDMIVKEKGEYVGVREMRKHIAWYIKGMHNATKVKVKVFKETDIERLKETVCEIFN